jgi:hypothetical protein
MEIEKLRSLSRLGLTYIHCHPSARNESTERHFVKELNQRTAEQEREGPPHLDHKLTKLTVVVYSGRELRPKVSNYVGVVGSRGH